jgi:hypothetical protein
VRALTGVWRTARRLVLGGALLLSAGAALAAAIGVPYVQVGHSEVIDRAHLTPDGRFAVTTSGDRTIRVWDVASGREIRSIEAKMKGLGEEAEVALSPDGAVIATTDSDGDDNFRVRRWDIATGRELPPINAKEASRLVFTPDGRSVVTLSWKSAKFTLHDIATGKPVRTFGGTAGDDAMAISPDSKWLAAFSETDEKVHVWDIRTGQRMKSLPYGRQTRADTPNHFEFSRDGSMLLASGFHETYLWDTATWTPRPLPAGRLRHGRFGATANVLVAEVTDSRPDAAYQGGRRNYDAPRRLGHCGGARTSGAGDGCARGHQSVRQLRAEHLRRQHRRPARTVHARAPHGGVRPAERRGTAALRRRVGGDRQHGRQSGRAPARHRHRPRLGP